MARWRLTASHYLNVADTFWEQIEVDQMTGKQMRRRYPVPLQLDVQDPTLWNANIARNPRGEILGGDIVVAHSDGAHEPKDYIFKGDPTPDMFPLDDEARAISARFADQWQAAPSEDKTYDQALIEKLEEKKAEAQAAPVQIEGMAEFLQTITEMMKQNATLIATLASAPKAEARR